MYMDGKVARGSCWIHFFNCMTDLLLSAADIGKEASFPNVISGMTVPILLELVQFTFAERRSRKLRRKGFCAIPVFCTANATWNISIGTIV